MAVPTMWTQSGSIEEPASRRWHPGIRRPRTNRLRVVSVQCDRRHADSAPNWSLDIDDTNMACSRERPVLRCPAPCVARRIASLRGGPGGALVYPGNNDDASSHRLRMDLRNPTPAPGSDLVLTVFPGNDHSGWTIMYNEFHFDWLLQFERAGSPPPRPNELLHWCAQRTERPGGDCRHRQSTGHRNGFGRRSTYLCAA